jgi:hypothetical protein
MDRKKFSTYETNLLLELVHKYKNVLESKKNCAAEIEKKAHCWTKLATEFCQDAHVGRWTADQLKKKWENLKFSGKKEVRVTNGIRTAPTLSI